MQSESVSQTHAGPITPATTDALQRSVPVTLLVLAGPIIASMISRTVMSFVDFVMVSRLGTDAQAAIMPANMLLFCVISFGLGTVTSVNTFVSQSLGRGERAECGAYTWQGLHLSWIMAIVLLPCWLLVEPLFRWIGHAPDVRDMETAFTRIGLLGIGPVVAASVLSSFFTGIHRPMLGLVAAIVSNLFNFAANWVLIYGHLGFPAMGIRGSALATLMASILHAAILLVWMLSPHYAEQFATWRTWRPSWRRLKGILWVGLPAGVQFLSDIVSWTIFTTLLVGRFGTVQLAANNIAFQWLHVSFMPAVGMGVAVTVAVGKAIGQRRRDLARRYVRWAMAMNVAYMGVVGLAFALFRTELAHLMSHDVDVIAWTATLFVCCAIFQVFDALGITYMSALRGAGDTRFAAAAGFVFGFVIFVGGGFAVAAALPQLQSLGPWIVATVYIILFGLTMWARYQFGPWERIDLFGDTGDGEKVRR